MTYFLLWRTVRLRLLGWALGVAALLLALTQPAQAQTTTATDPVQINPAAPVMVRPDTATVRKLTKKQRRALAQADSAKRTERLLGFRVTRPQKAGFLALVPSAGQIYNKKYWKLPIVYGMVGGLGYWVYYQQGYYSDYVGAYNLVSGDITKLGTTEIPERIRNANSVTTLYNGVVFSRRYRDLSILIAGLGYGLQVLDAVVDAHLHDFDVSDNLTLNWQPTLLPLPGQPLPAPGFMVVLRAK